MLTTISLIPTEWILMISHLVHIMLANMTTICISALSIVSMEHADDLIVKMSDLF